MMSKIFSTSMLCLCLANATTTLIGKHYTRPRPPVRRQVFTPQIPGIPADLQPTQQQAAQVRTPESVVQLQRDFTAQAPAAPAAFNHSNQVPDPNLPMNGRTNHFTDDMFSESELSSSSDEVAREPRATRTNAQQLTSRRNYLEEVRGQHPTRNTTVTDQQVIRHLVVDTINQQYRALEQSVRLITITAEAIGQHSTRNATVGPRGRYNSLLRLINQQLSALEESVILTETIED